MAKARLSLSLLQKISLNTFKEQKMEKVSIIIPYKEDRGFLGEAIASVHAQTYTGEIELICSQSPGSVGHNLNAGIAKATGSFIKYLCDDDILPPDSIALSVEAFKPGIDFIHGCAENFWNDGRSEIYQPAFDRPTLAEMLRHNYLHGGSLMYRSSVFRKYGFFDASLWTGEEYDFNLRLLHAGATIGFCPRVLYRYRRHTGQKSLGNTNPNYQSRRWQAIEIIRARYR